MKQYENDVERYLDEIAQVLPALGKAREHFLIRMEESIAQYETELGAEANYDRLISYFGTPDKIAEEYAIVWAAERKSKMVAAIHNPWKKIVLLLCAMLLLVCIAWVSYNLFRAFFSYGQDYGVMTYSGK